MCPVSGQHISWSSHVQASGFCLRFKQQREAGGPTQLPARLLLEAASISTKCWSSFTSRLLLLLLIIIIIMQWQRCAERLQQPSVEEGWGEQEELSVQQLPLPSPFTRSSSAFLQWCSPQTASSLQGELMEQGKDKALLSKLLVKWESSLESWNQHMSWGLQMMASGRRREWYYVSFLSSDQIWSFVLASVCSQTISRRSLYLLIIILRAGLAPFT